MGKGNAKIIMKNNTKIFLKLMPLLIIFIGLFITGIFVTFFQSLHIGGQFANKPTIESYIILINNPGFIKSLIYTLTIAFISSVCSVITGTLIASGIWRLPYTMKIISSLYKIPLILPHITIAFITILFISQTGIFSRIGYHMGIINNYINFPNILYSGKGIGIIVAYIFKETSFVILLALGVLLKLPETQIQSAHMLGANPVQILFTVILPFIGNTLKMSFIIIFLYSLGAFDIPFVMSESQPEMMSVSIYNTFFKKSLIHRPEASAELIVLLIISLIILLWYFKHEKENYER